MKWVIVGALLASAVLLLGESSPQDIVATMSPIPPASSPQLILPSMAPCMTGVPLAGSSGTNFAVMTTCSVMTGNWDGIQ